MIRKLLPVFYWTICALEGVGSLLLLWNSRTLNAPTMILGLTPRRFVVMLIAASLTVLFAILAGRESRAKSDQDSIVFALLNQRFRLLISFLLFGIGLAVSYVFALSPLRVGLLHGYFLRLMPLFIWGALIFVQFFFMALILRGPTYWKDAFHDLYYQPGVQRIRSWMKSPAAGAALLIFSLLIGLTKVYYGRFVDEADTITVGWLLSEGHILYGDVFSHHFPFSYYWAAGVISLFGNSFVAIRVSILLLHIVLFAICMGMTRYYLVIGLISLVWNLINQFHRGQEVIYPTFNALFMVVVFILIFSLLVNRSAADKFKLSIIGLLLGLAILSSPLMVYPASVAFAGLFGSGLFSKSPLQFREGLRRVLWAGFATALVVTVFAFILFASGTLQEFYRNTIWFNAEIYSKYVDAEPVRVGKIAQNIATGLDILNPQWIQHISPFIPLETYRSVSLADENLYFSWIFSSLLFRLSILACVTGLILSRRIGAGIFLYLFSAALLIRADSGFYANGFSLVGIFAVFFTIVELHHPAVIEENISANTRSLNAVRKAARVMWVPLTLVLAAMQLWPAFRGAYFLADNWHTVTDDRHVTMYEELGDEIRAISCYDDKLELSVFPINPIVNFVTGIPPASKYVFMYPWVAEVGQKELINELKENPAAVVWINTNRKADSPQGVAAYMADTIDFLNEEYILVRGNLWMSPELPESCEATHRGVLKE